MCAKAQQVFGGLLAVYQGDAEAGEMGYGGGKSGFGSIGAVGKHGFAVKNTADLYAVKSADQFAVFRQPCFKRVGMSQLVQRGISSLKSRCYPCAVLFGTDFGGAGCNHGGEIGVDGNAVGLFFQGFGQRTADVQVFRLQDGARMGGEPVDIRPVAEPREDAQAVGCQDLFGRDAFADADEAVGIAVV